MPSNNFIKLFFIALISSMLPLKADILLDTHANSAFKNLDEIELTENQLPVLLTIDNKHFITFIKALVETHLQEGNVHNLSKGLLNCYDKIHQNNYQLSLIDLNDAFSDLMNGLEQLQQGKLRAYSPLVPENNITCDFAEVNAFLHEKIYTFLLQCCENSQSGFNITFTSIFDINSTLTECCQEITNDFNGTFSVLSFGFNSTYSILFNGFSINIGLTNEVSTLVTLQTTIQNCFNNLELQYAICCQAISNLITQVSAALVTLNSDVNNLNNLANNTNCVLTDVFPFAC